MGISPLVGVVALFSSFLIIKKVVIFVNVVELSSNNVLHKYRLMLKENWVSGISMV